MAWRRIAIVAFVLAAVAGCDLVTAPEEGVRFEIGQRTYAVGDTLTATLRNASSEDATYNFCFAIMDRREGGAWTPVGSLVSPNGICTAVGIGLPAHGEATLRVRLRPTFTTGVYRLRMNVERVEVATATFQLLD